MVALVALGFALAGCGGGDPAPTTAATGAHRGAPKPKPKRKEGGKTPAYTVAPAHCPTGHPACRTTQGRIVYVERVDPDGDGDAHFVVIDPQGITLPGLTAIDVRKGLRPHPLPGIGDLVAAAGPVQTGSYGQDQIHALTLHVGKKSG